MGVGVSEGTFRNRNVTGQLCEGPGAGINCHKASNTSVETRLPIYDTCTERLLPGHVNKQNSSMTRDMILCYTEI